jgi:hypothetical protein
MIASTREVKVFVGVGLSVEEIAEALNEGDDLGDESTKLFEVAHALLSQHADDRAEIHQVEVTGVQVDDVHPTQLQVQFTTSWSAYYGCRDMDTADDQDEDESVTYTSDGHLIFTVPEPRRSASEC